MLIVLKLLKELVQWEIKEVTDREQVRRALKSCFSSKQLGNEEFLAELVGDACSKFTNKKLIKNSFELIKENKSNFQSAFFSNSINSKFYYLIFNQFNFL